MRRGAVVLAVLGVVSLFVTGAFAASGSLSAARETEAFYDDEAGGDADADDPAVWLHPSKRAQSIVVGTLKNAGLAVFDLKGTTLQRITPTELDGDTGRFNNVDVVYGATIGGKTQDLAVVTDRGLDRIRVYRSIRTVPRPGLLSPRSRRPTSRSSSTGSRHRRASTGSRRGRRRTERRTSS